MLNNFIFTVTKKNRLLSIYIYIYIYYLEIYPFTMGATTTGVIVDASIRYKVIFTNDT